MTAIRTTRYVLKALTAIRDTRSQAGMRRLDARDDRVRRLVTRWQGATAGQDATEGQGATEGKTRRGQGAGHTTTAGSKARRLAGRRPDGAAGTALQGDNWAQRLADGQGATESKTRRRRGEGHTTAVGLAEADGGGAAGDTNGGGVAGTLRYFSL